MDETIEPMSAQIDQQQLAQQLVESARSEGVKLVGPGGVLTGLTKQVLETALEAEMTEHLGYKPHDPAGHHNAYSRNRTRSKTVQTEVVPVEIEVPRDRAGSFEPQLSDTPTSWDAAAPLSPCRISSKLRRLTSTGDLFHAYLGMRTPFR